MSRERGLRSRTAAAAALALILGIAGLVASPTPAAASVHQFRHSAAPTRGLTAPFGCATKPAAHHAACQGQFRALRAKNGTLVPLATTAPSGYGPVELESAYGLTGAATPTGATVAIVDAYDDPNVAADLAVYRSTFGLPACTAASGCFKKINEHGAAAPLPAANYSWALEISLDVDMVSAACPGCHIVLVEASSNSMTDLGTAVNAAAATPGVVAISNSYGGSEDNTVTSDDKYFNHPGIAVTASSGDGGYGVEYPASSPYVTGVGGTSLSKASNTRGWTETAWSGAGSGCSKYEPKHSWQTDTGCANRTVSDVSAVADPNTGVAVYDTANSCGTGALCALLISLGLATGSDGWVQVGGTSAASPIVASVWALAGNAATATTASTGAQYVYQHAGATTINDITSGSNGSCGGSYLCTAGPGYDGPTGLGTPHGTGAF